MLTYPKSTMRVRRMPMHLSSSHVTLMPGKFYPPPNFPQSDLGRQADSRWALPQICSFIFFYFSLFYCCSGSACWSSLLMHCRVGAWMLWAGLFVSTTGAAATTSTTALWRPRCCQVSITAHTYLTLPPWRTGFYTCPALRSYQLGPMPVPECNHKVTGNGYTAIDGCQAVNRWV